ncbi:MAG: cation:proton antiporter [Thermoplasmatota archaeon]
MINIILMLLLILVIARLFGELFERKRLPVIVGEIMAGILIGPAVLGLVEPGPLFNIIVDLALFFIIFTTGLEFSLSHVKRDIRPSLYIAFVGNGMAFLAGIVISLALGFEMVEALFISCVFSLTALPVALRVLTDLKLNNTRFGHLVISSSILDDLFSIILLSLIIPLALAETYTINAIVNIILKMSLFLIIIYLINRFFKWRHELPTHYIKHYIRKLHSREIEFTIILLMGLGLAFLGEIMGVTFIIGAFYAGAIISERVVGERVFNKTNSVLNTISFGFFGPLFFAYIGMNFIRREFWFESTISEILLFLFMGGIFILFAFIGKAGGVYFGARISKIKSKTAATIGTAMNARGLMGLVIAGYGFEMGIISDRTLSLLIIMSVVTTLITPLFLKKKLKKDITSIYLEEKPDVLTK